MFDSRVIRSFPVEVIFNADIGRNLLRSRTQTADDGTERRAASFPRDRGSRRFLPRESGVETIPGMQIGDLRSTQNGKLVGDSRLHRHQLADLDAGHVGADGTE